MVGASGYSGAELLKILSRHPHARIDRVFAGASAGKRVDEVHPWFRGGLDLVYESYAPELVDGSDLVFLALPSGEAMAIVPELLERNKRVIDLSGDFRLPDPAVYRKYYRREHAATHLLSQAAYGMPEWNREAIRSSRFVANPGCYPTSAILPLAPLLSEGVVGDSGIIICSMSGVSGAGRGGSVETSFSEVNESVRAYKVGTHQHIPEIARGLELASGRNVSLTFTPHLMPITRGIYTNIYAPIAADVDEERIAAIYRLHYGDEPFVRWSAEAIPEIRNVTHTNYIDIGFRIDRENGGIILLSAIDNLVKGAAGQGVHNMNILFGFDETEGLL
ncbi:MAG: N-acetyl-gamma-glutamyl-phosphate reductase [Chlorobi bacterium]|nr:N-acetyl-gamma-glutamyl-phosphate reductase [Chlorobiota bacterium]